MKAFSFYSYSYALLHHLYGNQQRLLHITNNGIYFASIISHNRRCARYFSCIVQSLTNSSNIRYYQQECREECGTERISKELPLFSPSSLPSSLSSELNSSTIDYSCRYACIIEYRGQAFCGSSSSPVTTIPAYIKPSVQSCIEDALKPLSNGRRTPVIFAGRTDSGVHSLGQVIHFDLIRYDSNDLPLPSLPAFVLKNIFESKFRDAAYPPHSLHIANVRIVNKDFHARHSAISRTYIYRIILGGYLLMEEQRAWQITKLKLDIDKMRESAKLMEGEHDFAPFRAKQCESRTTKRILSPILFNIERPSISRSQSSFSSYPFHTASNNEISILSLTFTSRSFLMRQVRNIVGLLVKVGIGKISITQVDQLMKGDATIQNLGGNVPAPAFGLYLAAVTYPDEYQVDLSTPVEYETKSKRK